MTRLACIISIIFSASITVPCWGRDLECFVDLNRGDASSKHDIIEALAIVRSSRFKIADVWSFQGAITLRLTLPLTPTSDFDELKHYLDGFHATLKAFPGVSSACPPPPPPGAIDPCDEGLSRF